MHTWLNDGQDAPDRHVMLDRLGGLALFHLENNPIAKLLKQN